MLTIMRAESIKRWRPYLVALVAALLLVAFPARDDGDDDVTATTTGAQGAEQVAGDGGVDLPAGSEAQSTGVVTPAGRSASASGSTVAGGSAPIAGAPAVTGAGLNSPDAVAAPDCDRSRRRMKVAFTRAAPCAVVWPDGADNGGATAQGVTAAKVRIVIYNPPTDPSAPPIGSGSAADLIRSWKRASEPFERFYRMWGRTMEYAVHNGTGNDEVSQRADAIEIANMKPFAAVQVTAGNTILLTELAARKVIAVANAGVSQALAAKLSPYVWGASVQPAEQIVINAAHYVSKRLLGKPAQWAGQAEYQVTPRKFGLLQTSDVEQGLFEREFAQFGGTLTDKQTYAFGPANAGKWAEQARTLVARMKSKGVTSVIAVSDFLFLGFMTKEATNQRWFPEWVVTGLLGSDIDLFAKTFDQVQWQRAFGAGSLYPGSTLDAPQFHFQKWYWGPEWDGRQETGLGPDEAPVLHSGIHGAGPTLNPETFRDGLFAVAPSGGAAEGGLITMVWSYGRWGYYPGDDYNGYDDFVEIWWDATGRGRDNLLGEEGVGLYRYVNRGKRYFFHQWPAGDPPMFEPEGTAPYYTDYPTPHDRPPDFPCDGCPSDRG